MRSDVDVLSPLAPESHAEVREGAEDCNGN